MTTQPTDTVRKPLLFALSLAFTARVKQGDRVRQGDVLAEVNLACTQGTGQTARLPHRLHRRRSHHRAAEKRGRNTRRGRHH